MATKMIGTGLYSRMIIRSQRNGMNSERYSHKHSISIMCNQVVDGAMTATIEIVTVDLDDFIFFFFAPSNAVNSAIFAITLTVFFCMPLPENSVCYPQSSHL